MVYKYVKIVKICGTSVDEADPEGAVELWMNGTNGDYVDFGVNETDDSGLSKKEAILTMEGIFQIMSRLLTFP